MLASLQCNKGIKKVGLSVVLSLAKQERNNFRNDLILV